MATPADVVKIALAENGYHDGQGYDEVNKYAQYFGINYGIAYCDLYISFCFARAGVPLPKMGTWIASGSQYCPESYNYASTRGGIVDSWEAHPGYQVIFNWLGDGQPLGGQSHTELVETYQDGYLYTIGANSGPSNVDGFKGVGGVHRHAWYCPVGVGNPLIQGVIDTSKLVTFTPAEVSPVIEKDWLTMATEAEVEAVFDRVLHKWFGGAIGPGQTNVAGTIGATLHDVQKVYNEVHEINAHFAAAPVTVA